MGIIGKDNTSDGTSRRRKPTAAVLGRAAAYIDSEGSMQLSRQVSTTNGSANPIYHLSLHVTNTDPRLLYWFQRYFGGYIYSINPQREPQMHSWRWTAESRDRERILTWLMPHFLLKREQATIALKFLQFKRIRGAPGARGHTREEVEKMEFWYQRIKELRRESYYRSVHPQRLSEAAPPKAGMQ